MRVHGMKKQLVAACCLLLTMGSVCRAEDEPEVPVDKLCEEITESDHADDDHFFNFYQHDERLDPNNFVKVVFKIMSSLKPDPIKKVVLDYNPVLHHLVGPYSMRSTVVHLTPDGSMVEHCYDIQVQIHDTNECAMTEEHSDWMHACDSSAECVNTLGGYACACAEGKFALAGSGEGKCSGGESGSVDCCGEVTYDGSPHGDAACRSAFQCHSDSCAVSDCHADADCSEGDMLSTWSCACKAGYRDVSAAANQKPGTLCEPVDHCAANEAAASATGPPCPVGCGCRNLVDAEHDGFVCVPLPGHGTYYPSGDYEWINSKPPTNPRRLDSVPFLCPSQAAPQLALLGKSPLVLRQGDVYEEHGVKIVDDSTADLARRFETDYTEALGLMDLSGFVQQCGTNTVTYSLQTPWVQGREAVSVSRTVTVTDVDECSYAGDDPAFHHQCRWPATCRNKACGGGGGGDDDEGGLGGLGVGYECVCEQEGYEPDGAGGCAIQGETVPVPLDCEGRLQATFKSIQWCLPAYEEKMLHRYKYFVKELYEAAWHGEDGSVPPPHEWDAPYRSLPKAELTELAVARGLASPMGARALTVPALIGKLATADRDALLAHAAAN